MCVFKDNAYNIKDLFPEWEEKECSFDKKISDLFDEKGKFKELPQKPLREPISYDYYKSLEDLKMLRYTPRGYQDIRN